MIVAGGNGTETAPSGVSIDVSSVAVAEKATAAKTGLQTLYLKNQIVPVNNGFAELNTAPVAESGKSNSYRGLAFRAL